MPLSALHDRVITFDVSGLVRRVDHNGKASAFSAFFIIEQLEVLGPMLPFCVDQGQLVMAVK